MCRRAKYSLDDDNKRAAQARADEWHERAEGFKKIKVSSAENIEKTAESGILKEESKKPITPITNKAIERVLKVDIEGYTEEQCVEIQKQHKELLEYSKNHNDNKEVAFVFRKNLKDRQIFTGSDDKLDFGTSLSGMGKNLTILHNHPRNSSVSFDDLIEFIGSKSIKTMSVIKNNGGVEILTKMTPYNKLKLLTDLYRLKKKFVKNNLDSEFKKVVKKSISKYETTEVLKWIK